MSARVKRMPVAGRVLDALGKDVHADKVGEAAVADGGCMRCLGCLAGSSCSAFCRNECRSRQMGPQPEGALGKGLGVGVDSLDVRKAFFAAQKAVGDAREKLCLDDHRELQKEVKAYAHGSLQGVFQWHYAEIAGGGVHFLEDSRQVHAGAVPCAVAQKFQACEVGEGSLWPKVGDP